MSHFVEMRSMIADCARALATGAPEGWESLVFYVEFLRIDGDLDQQSILSCVNGSGVELDYFRPAHVEPPIRRAFEAQESQVGAWTALKIGVSKEGSYRSRFYFDTPPGLSGNDEEANRRLDEVDADV